MCKNRGLRAGLLCASKDFTGFQNGWSRKMKALALLLAACLMLTSCDYIAEHTAKKKSMSTTRSKAAIEADKLFWATFHGGRYDEIQPALEAETAAYLADPHDDVSAAHIAWLHIWRISERARLATIPASITDDA